MATFTGVVITGTKGDYTLTATGRNTANTADLASADSDPITLGFGAIDHLTVKTQPSGAVSGVALTGQPVVAAQDAQGNTDPSYGRTVTLTVASHPVAGSAAQIVLTQVVPRERLVEAHAKNALASSGAEVAGPGLAGALIKMVGAPVALLVDAFMLMCSVLVLKGLPIKETVIPREGARFWPDLLSGLKFVRDTPLLVVMAAAFWFLTSDDPALAERRRKGVKPETTVRPGDGKESA